MKLNSVIFLALAVLSVVNADCGDNGFKGQCVPAKVCANAGLKTNPIGDCSDEGTGLVCCLGIRGIPCFGPQVGQIGYCTAAGDCDKIVDPATAGLECGPGVCCMEDTCEVEGDPEKKGLCVEPGKCPSWATNLGTEPCLEEKPSGQVCCQ